MNIESLVMSGGAPVVGPMVAGEAAAAGSTAALAAAVVGVPAPELAGPTLLRPAAVTAAAAGGGDAVVEPENGTAAPNGHHRQWLALLGSWLRGRRLWKRIRAAELGSRI